MEKTIAIILEKVPIGSLPEILFELVQSCQINPDQIFPILMKLEHKDFIECARKLWAFDKEHLPVLMEASLHRLAHSR